MFKTVNECVGCPSNMGCLGSVCPYYQNNVIMICDECKDETDKLFEADDKQLCLDCLLEEVKNNPELYFDEVTIDDYEQGGDVDY